MLTTSWNRVKEWLLATPPPQESNHRPRLLAGLLLVLTGVLLVIAVVLLNLALPPAKTQTYGMLLPAVWVMLALAYRANRRGHYLWGAWLLVGSINLLVIGIMLFDPTVAQGDVIPLFYTIFPIIIAGILLSGWSTALVAGVQVGLIALATTQWLDVTTGVRLMLFLSVHGILAVAANLINRRNREQIDRQNQQLRANEERLSLVLEGSQDGFWDYDLTTGQTYTSPRAAAMLGYDLSAVQGYAVGLWMDLVHPDDLPGMVRAFEAHMAGNTPFFHSEQRMRHKNGHWVWVELRGKVAARNPEGRPIRAAGTQTDITARKQAEQTLQEERVRLRAILTASRDGMVLVGHRGVIYIVNQPALTLLGLPGSPANWEGRLIYRALHDLSHPLIAGDAHQEIARIKLGAEPPGEGEWELPNQHVAWFNLPVMAGERWLGRLLVLRDVTQERQADQLNRDLTHAMVHDLRSPLTSILATFDLLAFDTATPLADDQKRMLDLARTQANAMLNLVNGILEMHLLESGHMPLELCAVRPADLMLEGVYAQSALALMHRLQVHTQVPTDLPPVWGDPSLLRRVMQNLVNNALKFTPEDGAITVSAQALPEASPMPDHVQFRVHNTGPSIPPDLQAQLFRKFVTGQVRGRGTGLGLAFCRLVAEAHHGRIGVESNPDHGTTFYFTVPVAASGSSRGAAG